MDNIAKGVACSISSGLLQELEDKVRDLVDLLDKLINKYKSKFTSDDSIKFGI